MIQVPEESRWLTIEGFVEAFEAAFTQGEEIALRDFLPPRDNVLYLPVLRELVRVDLELSWERGCRKRLDDYAAEYPELFHDAASVREIAFEEYRVRRQAGEGPSPDDYRRDFGVDTVDWPSASETAPPEVGGEFLGFELIAELGRGAFGRVYLARQASLANRWIALKVSADAGGEPQTLAQLQHTHIVPVYSVHRRGTWQAVCMPYLGSTTLADVLEELRGRTAWPDSGLELLSTVVNRRQRIGSTVCKSPTANARANGTAQPGCDPAPAGERAQPSTAIFDALGHLNFVESVVWIAVRLADGLAHAHERGILHCDLKPANVLITDEGQPMLVDFNLAADMKSPSSVASALVGGTLPYMAPEQLEALRNNEPAVDARSDIFALGVILFELLTGRLPFPFRQGPLERVVPEMLADRAQSAPRLRCWNPAVSPAVESIVRCCLQPDATRRYPTAHALQEDLDRHLAHLPLLHAAEPSIRERLRKWTRRHPRLISAGGVTAIATLALASVGAILLLRGEHIARMQAADNFRRFHDASKSVQVMLTAVEFDATRRGEGLGAARQALEIYGVLDNSDWRDTRAVRRLDDRDATRLRVDVADVLVAMARTVGSPTTAVDSPGGVAASDRARELNRLAESCFAPGEIPRAVWMQRSEWARAAGDAPEAKRLDELADRAPLRTATDYYQVAAEHLSRGRFHHALPLLEQARRHDRQNLAVWLALGICHAGLGQFADAAAEFEACSALWPDSHWPHFQQALVRLDERDYAKARAALDRAIELRPDHVESYINRGLARFGLGDFAGADQDYTRALDLVATQTRVYFMRANARDRMSDPAGAKHDRELGLSREPTDELSWIARGVARLGGDPAGALADFEHALKVNPRSRAAMENKAHVLSERMGKAAEAIEVLNAAIELHPNYIPARAGRGVLLARLGDRAAAHADAAETLARDKRPGTLYQIAGIYALTSRDQPDDRRQALRLLASAIRQEPRWLSVVPKDPDLDPIRDDADFRRLVQSLTDITAVGDPVRSESK